MTSLAICLEEEADKHLEDSDSIFENLFGGGRGFGGFGRQRGSDLLHETFVTLEDVLHGKRMDLDIQKNVDCPDCNGTGCSPGTSKTKCSDCNGQGQVQVESKYGVRDVCYCSTV